MKKRSKKSIKMEVVNANAAGIDIGSKSHLVAIGQGIDHVREYGVYSYAYEQPRISYQAMVR